MSFNDIEEGDQVEMVVEMDSDYLKYDKLDDPTHDDAEELISKQYPWPQYVKSDADGVPTAYYCLLGPNGPVYLATGSDADEAEPVTMWAVLKTSFMWNNMESVDRDDTPFTELLTPDGMKKQSC